MALQPGEHVLLQLKTGDGLLRQAVVLTLAHESTNHLVLTPSRAIKDVDFSALNVVGILLWDGKRLPAGITPAMANLDSDSARGRFTAAEIAKAEAEAAAGPRPAPGMPGGPSANWPSDEAPPLAAPRLAPQAPGSTRPDVDEGSEALDGLPLETPVVFEIPGAALVVLAPVPLLGLKAGDPFHPSATAGYMGATYGIAIEADGIEVPFRRLSLPKLKGFLAEMEDAWTDGDKTPTGGKPPVVDGDDVRTLPTRWDGEERIRDFAESVALMHVEEFTPEEFPNAEVGRHAMWWLKMVKRQTLTGITHHTKWVHESSIHVKERAVYEHEVLSHAIDAFVTIDQLNCPNLLGFEILVRRLMLLEEAFSGDGGADFSMSEDWMGLSSRPGGALVAPGLLKSVSVKQAEKNVISKERRKAAEERRFRTKVHDQNEREPKAKARARRARTDSRTRQLTEVDLSECPHLI